MARAKVVRPAELGTERREPAKAEDYAVLPVPTKATPFVTIYENAEVWRPEGEFESLPIQGSFVRIRPPINVTDEEFFDDLVRHAKKVSLGVKVERPKRDAVVVSPKERAPHKAAREVVSVMVDEANTSDREALRSLCEQIMGEEGL